ncbi:hypothetical protein BE20_05960 [Sorangium cellulosum]|nr:hypothetical protein BE20_05960 [Sorangium cellulosum]
MIAKEKEAEVLRLYHGEKWPVGTIAGQLGLHHTTVQRVLGQAGVDPKVVAPRFVPFIIEQLVKYPLLRSSRLFVMLKEVICRLRPKKPAEAFQRLRTLPGEQAQVDCYSRRIFLRFFPGASMPFFVRGHVEAFADFGGVPRVLLYDNLKSAVVERHGDAIRFHPTLLDLSAHYRFEPRPVAVRVERAIRYVREAFFEARTYADLGDLNRQATEWTRQAFDDERSVLLRHPDIPFPAHERVEVEVGKTPYARFDLNDYSVPHDRTRRTLVVLADLDQVRIADGTEIVATHVRSWDRGQQLEQPEHIQRLVDEKRRAREHRGLDRLARAARSSQAFLRIVAERGDNIGSAIARLLQLLDAVGAAELEEALVEVLERDTIHVGAVRQVLDRRRSERCLPPPVSIPVTRGQHAALVVTPHSLATYDALKKDSTP